MDVMVDNREWLVFQGKVFFFGPGNNLHFGPFVIFSS